MVQKINPFLELKYGWDFGESGWNNGMDENLLKTGYMFDGNVDAIVSSLPPPVNSKAYFLTTDNRLYFVVGSTFYSSPCPKWFIFKIRSSGDFYQFNGTSAVLIDNPAQVDAKITAAEVYTDTVMSDHEAAVDPHPQYLTQTEGDARYLQTANTQIFGQRSITTNVTAIPKTAAVDPTLVSNADYTQVTGIFTALPDGISSGVTQQTNSMLIETTGPYEIKVWCSFTSSVNNTNVAFKFAINGVIGTARRPRARVGTTGDRVSVAAHGYINLTAGDVVTLWFASDQTANITLEDAVFSVVYLGAFS